MRHFLITAAYESDREGIWINSFVYDAEEFPNMETVNDACSGLIYAKYLGFTGISEIPKEVADSYR